jgi:hexosaminidase
MSHRKSPAFELTRSAWILILAFVTLMAGCAATPPVRGTLAPLPLLPAPASVERSPGYFSLRRGAPLILRSDNAQALGVARYFVDLTQRTHSLHLDLRPLGARDTDDAIVFVLDPKFLVSGEDGTEGYELSVSTRRVLLEARTPRGLFYGAVTLWQLLDASGGEFPLHVPNVAIADHPRFAWRGVMLDSARQYQSPEFIKHFIDTLALHKLNVLHWHLTDDQGWRIEIKKYPKLTEVGAWRIPASIDPMNPGGPPAPRYGGFYTQEQIRDIVRYAAERFISIVPEIEMPGHAQAAIAAYPELGVSGKPVAVSHDWGVHTYLYNVDESTFTFLENVLTEVMDLFPGTYIHVGGDEAAKDQWQASAHVQARMRELGVADETALQSYFITRIERFLGDHGRKLIGWDEILQGGLPPRATVMSWRGTQGGIDAARLGHDVVMSPSPPMYFDHVQSPRHDEPPGRPDVVSLADVYAYEPLPQELDKAQAQHVLGAQANLWSEYMDTPQRVEHAAFPRVAALAEVLWSAQAQRNWPDFQARLPAQLGRYRALGIVFADNTSAVEAVAANIRNSDELLPCKPGLPLRLPGPGAHGNDGVYRVDIFDPCWIYPQVDLGAVRHVAVAAATLPYNFQLWKDAEKVVLHKPATAAGELQLHADNCDGDLLLAIPLAGAGAGNGTAKFEAALPRRHGRHDVCLVFTRATIDPMWAIDTVQWLP